ncbi:MAG TPA: PKD domain-containing protein [Candidatus Acidoferrum sp.]|nr:PKD domain-containing protein [Candidatus Acidoferrum sp.]
MTRMNQVIQAFTRAKQNAFIVAGAFVVLSGATVAVNDIAFPLSAAACHCDTLQSTKVNDTTYTFSSVAIISSSVHTTKVVYDFGDGSTDTEAKDVTKVTHTFKPGTYTVKATVYFSDGSISNTAGCTKKITIPQPPATYMCNSLDLIVVNADSREYQFTAHASTTGNATLVDANFTFGDSTTASGIKPSSSNVVSVNHTYAAAGTYNVTATLNFTADGKAVSVTCKTSVTTKQPPVECLPGIPVGDSRCNPTPKPPVTPTVLPSTGPSDMLGSAFGLSGIVAAGTHYVRSKKDLSKAKR